MAETFLLVDGENIDATLGGSLLGRRPEPEERPRWDRVKKYGQAVWEQPARGLFYLNGSGQIPMSFVQALDALDYRPVLLSGPPEVKVVDVAIQRTLEALVQRDGDVLLGSHDRDFLPQVEQLMDSGHGVAMLGFPEMMSGAYAEAWVQIYDLEYDAKAFNMRLPRIRVIPLAEFDPEDFLD